VMIGSICLFFLIYVSFLRAGNPVVCLVVCYRRPISLNRYLRSVCMRFVTH
jgi:hypothetical protein